MKAGLRKFVLALHILASVGWLGAVAAYIVLDMTVAISTDDLLLKSCYVAMELITAYMIVPSAFGTLLSGVAISLGTRWGLFRHYWVLISFLLTVLATGVLLVESQTITYLAEVASHSQTSGNGLRDLQSTLVHSVGGLIVLALILFLNVYKPRGMTRYGWRNRH